MDDKNEHKWKKTLSHHESNTLDTENSKSDNEGVSQICLRVNAGHRSNIKSKSFEPKHQIEIPLVPMTKCSKSVRCTYPSESNETEEQGTRCWTMNLPHVPQINAARTLRINNHKAKKLNTQLLEAIDKGDVIEIEKLLNDKASPNATCRQSLVTGCHLAALMNNDSLAHLISNGADKFRPDKQGRTALHFAAWAGNRNQIALLLNFSKDLRDKIANNAIEAEDDIKKFITHEHRMLVNMPCNCGVDSFPPNTWQDSMEHNCKEITGKLPSILPGWSPLHAASARARADCVRLLLAAGADANARDLIGVTALDVVGSAHYDGYSIDVSEFIETISILLAAGSKFNSANLNSFCDRSTPLHTAVALESLGAIKELLDGGASPTCLNSQRLTPMHVCVEKRLGEHLKLLANHESVNLDPNISIVDAQDSDGLTVLHYAVKRGWAQGVCIALGAEADVTIKAKNGDFPLHTAANIGDVNIFQEILTEITTTKGTNAVNYRNSKSETVLMIAIAEKHHAIVKILLEKKFNVNTSLPNNANVLHIAAKTGSVDILELLLNHSSFNISDIINSKTEDESFTPLMFAVLNNHPNCVVKLISKGANVKLSGRFYDGISSQYIYTTALHIAASKGYIDIAKLIIDNDVSTIEKYNSEGRLPLHEACSYGNRDLITLLLHNGSDISQETQSTNPKTKTTALHMLMDNISKPTAFMEEVFDTYISTRGMSLQETDCEVRVNYGILLPNRNDPKQLKVIKALLKTGNRYGQRKLLLHPLVQSFLCLKWKALLSFFYMLLALYAFYVVVLNVYVVSKFIYIDDMIRNKATIQNYTLNSTGNNVLAKDSTAFVILTAPIWKYLVYVATTLILVQETVFIKIENYSYFMYLETWIKFGAIILSFILPSLLPDINSKTVSISDTVRHIAGFALLLAWTEFMFLLSRFPNCGFYVLMFGKVAGKVIKIICTFGFLILGFSLCFMIQFHENPPFGDPLSSLVKTFVMMTSEYDYGSTIDEEKLAKTYSSITIIRTSFVIFLIIISIVLMNLMVGVAVNDVNNLEMIGNIKRIEKQVEFLTSLEDIVSHKVIIKILPKQLSLRLSTRQKLNNLVILRPRQATCKYYKYFPRYIREAIFENAHFQNMQRDDELGTESFKQNLEEIHEAIVKREATFDSTKLLTAIENLNEELKNIKEDMTYLKKFASKQMRRPSI